MTSHIYDNVMMMTSSLTIFVAMSKVKTPFPFSDGDDVILLTSENDSSLLDDIKDHDVIKL